MEDRISTSDNINISCSNKNSNETDPAKNYSTRWTKFVREYCEISSIQGLSYLIKDISLFERLWWIIVLLSCITGCSIMIYQVFDKWITTPVLVSLATQETPIYEVPFPAITICPETKISKQCLNYTKVLIARKTGDLSSISFKESQNFDYMTPLCGSSYHDKKLKEQEEISTLHSRHESESLDDYAKFLSECSAIDLSINAYCQWMGNDADCEKILTPVLTDEGLCYSFNMFDVRDIYSDINVMKYYRAGERNLDWYPGLGFPPNKLEDTYPRRTFSNGAKNSLVVVFFTGKSDIYYACREFALQGIRVSLHMPATIPRPSQVFFSVGLDRLTTVAVTPTLMTTTDSIQQYDPHRRDCYYEKEKKLKYFKIYTQGNCNLECWTNFTLQHCGCTDFYMPRDNKTRICNMSKRECLKSAKVTYPQIILNERLRDSNNVHLLSDCDCLPLCSDLNYNSEIATGNWQFNDPDDVALDGLREWFDGFHASAVRVYFKDTFFLPTEKSELYGLTDFISNIGGVLGLFTGFSLFSVAEIIYFLTIRLIVNYRRYGYWFGQ